ncbi:hypothetical protein LZ30DRAFT_400696 [Colletotrichum cereale]|nr:hypothetical protein LZ30DRAFT_400696 [Colletotrichum cereale]
MSHLEKPCILTQSDRTERTMSARGPWKMRWSLLGKNEKGAYQSAARYGYCSQTACCGPSFRGRRFARSVRCTGLADDALLRHRPKRSAHGFDGAGRTGNSFAWLRLTLAHVSSSLPWTRGSLIPLPDLTRQMKNNQHVQWAGQPRRGIGRSQLWQQAMLKAAFRICYISIVPLCISLLAGGRVGLFNTFSSS